MLLTAVGAAIAAAATARYRARVSYDGGAYAGMQYQPTRPTVQGTLQRALARRCQMPAVRVVAAGRTDAGVHARGQAVHFDLDSGTYDPADLERSLGALLPPDLAVSHVERAGEVDGAGRSWHAIFWATGKRYSYRLYAGPPGGRDPTTRLYRHHAHSSPLDLDAMRTTVRAGGLRWAEMGRDGPRWPQMGRDG